MNILSFMEVYVTMTNMSTFMFFALSLFTLASSGQTSFEKYFTDKVLRFDFMLAGNSNKTVVYPVGMKEELWFAGSHENLIDPFNYGNFKYEVFYWKA